MSSVGRSLDVRGMNSKGTYYRSSKSLNKEIKSWSKNKMEDRRLAQRNDLVDRDMMIKRKTHLFEKDRLNKEMNEKICKTTLTTDEYLDRSYHRYAGWREKERERLDRRYNGLYRSYFKDLKSLSKGSELIAPRKQKSSKTSNSDDTYDVTQHCDDDKPRAESDSEEVEGDLLTLAKLNIDTGHRRFSVAGETMSQSQAKSAGDRRRGSTGGVMLPSDFAASYLKNARTLHKIGEDDTEQEKPAENENQDNEDGQSSKTSTPEIGNSAPQKSAPKKTGRRSSAGDILQQLQTSKRFSRRPTLATAAMPTLTGSK